jgi:small basic protein
MLIISIVVGVALGLLSNWALGHERSGWLWCAANAAAFILFGGWLSLIFALVCGSITAFEYSER